MKVASHDHLGLCILTLDAAHVVAACSGGVDIHNPVEDNETLYLSQTNHIPMIKVREDVRKEKDGPMLIHGLQGLHSNRIVAPQKPGLAPDPKLLEERFELFRQAG